MESSFGSRIVNLEDWDFPSLQRIEPHQNGLWLTNEAGQDLDEFALADALAQVPGREYINSLVVQPSSRLKHLHLVKALPALENLKLYGLRLQSFDGVESAQCARIMEINTGKNKKRTIAQIAETPIFSLALDWANEGDLEAVGASRTIRYLEIANCPPLPLDRWAQVPIEKMSLHGGKIDVLADTAILGLTHLTLYGHRHLERFEGDNGSITWLIIQQCNQVDWHTIRSFRHLAHLTIVGVKSEIPLSAFVPLSELRSLSFSHCKVQLDVMDLKRSAANLEELSILGLKQEQLKELSEVNSGVLVSNGNVSYRDGVTVSG